MKLIEIAVLVLGNIQIWNHNGLVCNPSLLVNVSAFDFLFFWAIRDFWFARLHKCFSWTYPALFFICILTRRDDNRYTFSSNFAWVYFSKNPCCSLNAPRPLNLSRQSSSEPLDYLLHTGFLGTISRTNWNHERLDLTLQEITDHKFVVQVRQLHSI